MSKLKVTYGRFMGKPYAQIWLVDTDTSVEHYDEEDIRLKISVAKGESLSDAVLSAKELAIKQLEQWIDEIRNSL